MVLVLDTSSECTLQKYEVSLIISNGYQVIEQTRFCNGQRQTDGRIEGRKGKIMCLPTLPGAGIITH